MIQKYFYCVLFLFVCSLSFSQNNVVADIKVQGNKRLKTSFVKKIASVKPNMSLDSLSLDEDMETLKRLPSVSHAYYHVYKTDEGSYDIIYNIEDAPDNPKQPPEQVAKKWIAEHPDIINDWLKGLK